MPRVPSDPVHPTCPHPDTGREVPSDPCPLTHSSPQLTCRRRCRRSMSRSMSRVAGPIARPMAAQTRHCPADSWLDSLLLPRPKPRELSQAELVQTHTGRLCLADEIAPVPAGLAGGSTGPRAQEEHRPGGTPGLGAFLSASRLHLPRVGSQGRSSPDCGTFLPGALGPVWEPENCFRG